MNNIRDRKIQAISSKVTDISFINLYEIGKIDAPLQFKEKITFTTTELKSDDISKGNKVVELLVGLKLVDEDFKNKTKVETPLSDSILRMSYLSKYLVASDQIIDGSINNSILEKMLDISINKIIAICKISLSTFGFGNLEFPIIDSSKLIENNK